MHLFPAVPYLIHCKNCSWHRRFSVSLLKTSSERDRRSPKDTGRVTAGNQACEWFLQHKFTQMVNVEKKENKLMSVPNRPLSQNYFRNYPDGEWSGQQFLFPIEKFSVLYFCTEISCFIGWVKIITSADFTYFSYSSISYFYIVALCRSLKAATLCS